MTTLPPPPPLEQPAPSPYGTGLVPYATWAQRAAGWLVDAVPSIILNVIGRAAGGGVSLVCGLLGLLYFALNICYWQGKTGQSIGKRLVGIKLIKEETGQPVGGWFSFGRQIVHILDALPILLGYLWPLWDRKKQTFADKILSTVVVSAK